MKPFALLLAAGLVLVPACGDDDDSGNDPIDARTVDAPPDVDAPGADAPTDGPDLPNSGFVPPSEPTVVLDDTDTEVAADWTCLGTPAEEEPATGAVAIDGRVVNPVIMTMDNGIADAEVTMHEGFDFGTSIGEATTDADGNFAIAVAAPAVTRYSFKVIAGGTFLDTYYVNSPLTAPTTNVTINAVNDLVITLFQSNTGETIMDDKTVVAASISDCQGRPVGNAVAMVSTEAGAQTHVDGADTYYPLADSPIPRNHMDAPTTNAGNGLFAIVNVPPAESSFVQVWGFVDADDLADGEMTLLGELEMPTVEGAFMSGGIQPLRTAQ